jgi:ribose transport system permease protein
VTIEQTSDERAIVPDSSLEAQPARRKRVSLGLDRFSGLYVIAAMIVLFGVWLPDTFLTVRTFRSVADDQAITVVLALAVTVTIAAGVFDLSVAALLGLVVVVVGWLQSNGWNAIVSIFLGIAVALLIGAVNGGVVVKLRVNSFIATLGMSSILAAAAYWVTNGQAIVSGFSQTFLDSARRQVMGVPISVIYMALIAAVLWFMLEHTPVGRYLYATGANTQAARLAGVSVQRMVILSLMLSALLAGIAGVILTAKLGTAPPTVGPPYLLPAFASAFLGSTQVKAGRVNVLGTIVAVYLLAIGVKGLQLAGAPSYVSNLFNGVALIVAVALAQRTRAGQDA